MASRATDPNAVYGAPIVQRPAAQPEPDLGWLSPETWGASWKRAHAQEDWGLNQRDHEAEIADAIHKALKARGVKVDRPLITAASVVARNFRGAPGSLPSPVDTLFEAYQSYREKHPDLLPQYAGITNRESLRAHAIGQRQRETDEADAVLARTTGSARIGAGLVAGIGRGLQDPSSYLPVPGAGASATLGQAILRGALWEGGANMALALAMEPLVRNDAAAIGVERTMVDTITDIGVQGLAGGVIGAGGGAIDHIRHRPPSALRDIIGEFDQRVSPDQRTPLEEAALRDMEMRADMEEGNPYLPTLRGDTAHHARSAAAQAVLAGGDAAPTRPSRRVKPAEIGSANLRDAEMGRYMAVVRSAESGGRDTAAAATSSAYGRYQFTSGTWLSYFKRRYPNSGLSNAQILAKRADGALQDLMMQDLTRDSARALSRAGLPATAENLYALHFAGQDRGVALLRAAPDAPISSVMSAEAIRANRALLEGKTVGEVRAKLARLTGGKGEAVHPRPAEHLPDEEWLADLDTPQLRPDMYGSPETHAREQLNLNDMLDASEGFDVLERQERAPDGAAYYRTEKGSIYRVEADGTTVRDKAPRPEHPGEQGVQPQSDATFYATKEDINRLAIMQAKGGEPVAITISGGHAAVRYTAGPEKGKLIPDTDIPIRRAPETGLHPVELWDDGARVHFGNAIVETSAVPPSGGTAAPIHAQPPARSGAQSAAGNALPARASSAGTAAPDALARFEPDGDGHAAQAEATACILTLCRTCG